MSGGIGSVIFGFIIWRATGNLILGAIVSVVLWPLINPLLLAFMQLIVFIFSLPVLLVRQVISLFEPDMPISVIKEVDDSSDQSREMGMRIFLVNKGNTRFFADTLQRETYESLVTTCIREQYGKNEDFRHKLDYVQEHHLPVKVCASWYQTVNEKCLSKWRKYLKEEGFKAGSRFELKKPISGEKGPKLNIYISFDHAIPKPAKAVAAPKPQEASPASPEADASKTPAQAAPAAQVNATPPVTDYSLVFDDSIITLP